VNHIWYQAHDLVYSQRPAPIMDDFDSFSEALESAEVVGISNDTATAIPSSNVGGDADRSRFESLRVAHVLQSVRDTAHLGVTGTGRWFLHSPLFQSWVAGQISPHLWVRGLPGSGKSILAAIVIAALRDKYRGDCGFFFCSDGEPSKRSAATIIQTIIHQLSQQCPDIANNLSQLQQEDFSITRSPYLIWRRVVMERDVSTSPQLYVVIDGLDECDQPERTILLDIIASNAHDSKISWVVFSRYLPDIAQSMRGPNIVIRPNDTMQDIGMYTEQLVDHSPSLRSKPPNPEVMDRVSKAASGMFVWVELMVKLLEEERSESNVLDSLNSFPLGMDSICERICHSLTLRLNDDHVALVSRIFGWIACASSPLTVCALSEAVGFPNTGSPSEFEFILLEHCRPLVSVSSSKMVGFIHRTIEEYLASAGCIASLAVRYRSAHTIASNVCLSYLSNTAFAKRLSSAGLQIDMTSLSEEYPLLSYSALFWPEHMDYARTELNLERLDQLSRFITSMNLLTTMEVALTIEGVASLDRWMRALSNVDKGLQDAGQGGIIKRFIFDFQRLIRHYGHILDKTPSAIHYLIDDSFPRNSHFWKYFGTPRISVTNDQPEEWHSLIATLNQQHITCVAVKATSFAAANETGLSVWDLGSFTRISQISNLPSAVLALAFNDRCLAMLSKDGSLKLVSTKFWEVTRTVCGIINMPTVVMNWSESRFWRTDYVQHDPLHVNLEVVGEGVLAANYLVNLETGEKRLVVPHSSSPCTISQLSCTKDGDLVTFSTNGDVEIRRLGSPASSIRRRQHVSDRKGTEGTSKRMLAVSTRGQFVATCNIMIQNGYSSSGNVVECLNLALRTSALVEQFANGDKITTAAFSADESMLAVSSYNAKTFADTTRVWKLAENPQLIWEAILYDDYTRTIHFSLEDTVLIKAGRFLRVWDMSERLCQFASPDTAAMKRGADGNKNTAFERQIANAAISLTERAHPENLRSKDIISQTAVTFRRWCTRLVGAEWAVRTVHPRTVPNRTGQFRTESPTHPKCSSASRTESGRCMCGMVRIGHSED
jgi:GPI inositol-deacylase, winged helix domain/NACHT domain